MKPKHHQSLKRELGTFGATMMGLGSMIGTGVFVSIGIAAGEAGPSIVLAIALAAVVATCNAFSSAQLAASHAVSGGTYEYGYRYLSPWLGVTAGWMFLCAKSASAATAALGFAGYFLHLIGREEANLVGIAVAAVAVFTILVLTGLRRSSAMNIAIVSLTLFALTVFAFAGGTALMERGSAPLAGLFRDAGAGDFFYATALMFVAYTGYARIATLGEEVKEPRRTIPRAIIITLIVTAVIYIAVAIVAIGAVGVDSLSAAAESQATPLEVAADALTVPGLPTLVAIGAVTAMLGVLLNLIIGLSRVVLAMGRQGDLPPLFGRLDRQGRAPAPAVVGVGLVVGALALSGDVETTWAFSAFTVLVYYAITNLAALQLPREQRIFPRAFAYGGLAACLFLAFWVPPRIWMLGLSLIALGLLWHWLLPRFWQTIARK